MATNVATISLEDLIADFNASAMDNGWIDLYVASGGDPEKFRKRYEVNEKIMEKIHAELEMRGELQQIDE
jgi:hypothetical protein